MKKMFQLEDSSIVIANADDPIKLAKLARMLTKVKTAPNRDGAVLCM